VIRKYSIISACNALLLLITLTLALPVDSATTDQQRKKAYHLLKEGNHYAVLALPKGDREILLGLLALDRDNTKEAITILSSKQVEGDPVAAMIRAEAYRRQSVQAAIRAGRYAHAVDDDIDRLKQARLSAGIDEAEQRLLTLIDSIERPPVAAPEVTTASVSENDASVLIAATRKPETVTAEEVA